MTTSDSRGLHLSTSSPEAAASYRTGIDLLLSAWPGAILALDAAVAADESFALAHAARARALAGRGEIEGAKAAAATAQARVAARGSDRERSHVEAITLAVSGRVRDAIDRTLAHLEAWPRDAMILSLPLGAFGLFAFSGMADHDQARVDLCERHAGAYAEDDWWFLTYRGWSQTENGSVGLGRALSERAYALRRENANAVHALSHAMFEDGGSGDATRLIDDWLPGYDRSGGLHGHIAWHQALCALDAGDVARALSIHEAHIRPPANAGAAINVVTDGASFLWRLDAYGHGAPRALWDEIARHASRAYPDGGNAFVEAHLALIAAATGDEAALRHRLDAVAARGSASDPAVVALGRAALAFAEGRHAQCAAILGPVAGEMSRIGGSHAQREIVEDTLLVALMRAGEAASAARILDERLHRRPSPRDARWRAGLAAAGPGSPQ